MVSSNKKVPSLRRCRRMITLPPKIDDALLAMANDEEVPIQQIINRIIYEYYQRIRESHPALNKPPTSA